MLLSIERWLGSARGHFLRGLAAERRAREAWLESTHGAQFWPRSASPRIMRSAQGSVLVGLGGHAAHLLVARLGVCGRSGCSFIITALALNEFVLRPCLCADAVGQAERAHSQ